MEGAEMASGAPETTAPLTNVQSGPFGALETAAPLTDAQIDGIARGLVAQLTREEKIGMMSGDTAFFEGALSMQLDGYQRQPRTTAGAIQRLGLPGVRFSDGPRGFHGEGATTFPQGSARGASFDPNLEERIGDAIGARSTRPWLQHDRRPLHQPAAPPRLGSSAGRLR